MKRAVILRGLPGSGKSTLAKEIAEEEETSVICSADDFFIIAGEYKFRPDWLPRAHQTCKEKFKSALKKGTKIVIVDNTNTCKWEFEEYQKLAKTFGYTVEVKIPETDWAFDVAECVKKNSHGVPAKAIQRMKDRWED